MNKKKTKYMKEDRRCGTHTNEGEGTQEVDEFVYLENNLGREGSTDVNVKWRFDKA